MHNVTQPISDMRWDSNSGLPDPRACVFLIFTMQKGHRQGTWEGNLFTQELCLTEDCSFALADPAPNSSLVVAGGTLAAGTGTPPSPVPPASTSGCHLVLS